MLGIATNITSAGIYSPTPIPIGGLQINPGETYGIYVTSTANLGVAYLNGTGTETFTDGNLLIDCTAGSGVSYPFLNNFQPRIWNGTIYYSTGMLTAPVNDDCAGALPIGIGETIYSYTTGANSDDGFYCGSCEQGTGGGIWYTWIGDGSNAFFSTSSVSSNFETHLRVFEGTCEALICVAGSDEFGNIPGSNSSFVNFSSTIGTPYYILVSGKGATEGFFGLSLENGTMGGESLTSLFGANNSFAGNMFDVTAFTQLTINNFSVNMSNPGAQETMEVYYKMGSHVGFESDATSWTLLGTPSVTSAGLDNPTLFPIGGLTLTPGQTYGFYINLASYGSGGSTYIGYTNGGPTTFQNADLSITTGVGKGIPAFIGGTFFPRQWNGIISYSVPDPCLTDTESPEIVCQNTSVKLDAYGNATITESDVVICKNDNCAIPSISFSTSNFDCSHLGTQYITATATDGNNNSATCNATIEVFDISDGDVLLLSQADVDAYAPPCDGIIEGTLVIQGVDITNLATLVNLIEVTESVVINQTGLSDLAGLSSLVTIGQDLLISNNTAVQNLDALNLSNLGETLLISNNLVLTNITGLGSLTAINLELIVSGNPSLPSLGGLENISTVGSGLMVMYNTALTDCCAIYDLLSTPGAIGGFTVVYLNASGCDNTAVVMATCAPADPLIGLENEEGEVLFESQDFSQEQSFIVFPNPASSELHITFLKEQAATQITLIDMQGRTVAKKMMNATTSKLIRVESFARGIYSMIITYPNGTTSMRKVLLQ